MTNDVMGGKSHTARVDAARILVRAALDAADNGNHAGEVGVLQMAAAGDLMETLRFIDGLEVMEINPSNYDHEIVCELNSNAVQAALAARAAIAKATGAGE